MKYTKDFMRLYDETVDEVFAYYYEQTHDRHESFKRTQETFQRKWDTIRNIRSHTDIFAPKSNSVPFFESAHEKP